ncbi:MAG: hypothetical protein L7H08_06280 [Vulcanisaeta sp.]|nr:hypothetical protein [Vulcanisaeta sp.]MCG2887647.1 hypothetical protein [Vulcanisaeta sp.]
MEYIDIDMACRGRFGDQRLMAMVWQRISSLNEDLDQSEQEFLANYAFQDLKYYLLYRFGLLNLDDETASYELCRRILRNEHAIDGLVNEWFNWWIIKWRQRVRLVFNEGDQKSGELGEGDLDDIVKKIPKKLLDKLRKEVMAELIRQNEVCSLNVISDFILKAVLNDLVNEYGRDNALRVLVTNMTKVRLRIIRKIMEISNTNTPLVILKVRINPSNQGIP